MESLVDRWKNVISSTEGLKNSRMDARVEVRKESTKEPSGKKRVKSHRSAKKIETPRSDKKNASTTKDYLPHDMLSNYTASIMALFPQHSHKHQDKIKSILIEFKQAWLQQNSHTKQNTGGIHQKLYNELERKYFECQKQRQHFRGKAQSLAKKIEANQRQMQRALKIEQLIDGSIIRETQLRCQANKAKKDLAHAQSLLQQQQQIFNAEVIQIRQIVEELKRMIPRE